MPKRVQGSKYRRARPEKLGDIPKDNGRAPPTWPGCGLVGRASACERRGPTFVGRRRRRVHARGVGECSAVPRACRGRVWVGRVVSRRQRREPNPLPDPGHLHARHDRCRAPARAVAPRPRDADRLHYCSGGRVAPADTHRSWRRGMSVEALQRGRLAHRAPRWIGEGGGGQLSECMRKARERRVFRSSSRSFMEVRGDLAVGKTSPTLSNSPSRYCPVPEHARNLGHR